MAGVLLRATRSSRVTVSTSMHIDVRTASPALQAPGLFDEEAPTVEPPVDPEPADTVTTPGTAPGEML